jgi:hypothetical protein
MRFTAIDGARPRYVALTLQHTRDTEQVYWSKPHCNSYVVNDNPTGYWNAPDGTPCDLLSINGHGEIRWAVTGERGGTAGDTDAAAYFGLTFHGYRG